MNWLRKFMVGRYGMDQLSNFLIILSIIMLVISGIFSVRILYLLALINIGFAYFRVFSKNINKRFRENNKFLQVTQSIRVRIRSFFNRLKGLKDFKYFKCSTCNQRIRVPRDKGKVKITCPKCNNRMIRRT